MGGFVFFCFVHMTINMAGTLCCIEIRANFILRRSFMCLDLTFSLLFLCFHAACSCTPQMGWKPRVARFDVENMYPATWAVSSAAACSRSTVS